MSTSAIIEIEGIEFARIYKHWDGYTDATLPFLEDFNKDFTKNRGHDPEYKFAQLLRATARPIGESYNLDGNAYLGWGVTTFTRDDYCGAEYLYILMSDGTVEWKELTIDNRKLLKKEKPMSTSNTLDSKMNALDLAGLDQLVYDIQDDLSIIDNLADDMQVLINNLQKNHVTENKDRQILSQVKKLILEGEKNES